MAQATRLKRSPASLFGAFVIAAGIFALWLLVSRQLGYTDALVTALGAFIATVVGIWIRVADL